MDENFKTINTDVAAAALERLILITHNKKVSTPEMEKICQIASLGITASLTAALLELGNIDDPKIALATPFTETVRIIRKSYNATT